MPRLHFLCFAVLVAMLCASLAFSQAVNSTVLGTVTDSSGAVVAGAKVTLTEADTNVSHTGQTNESGNFVFPDQPPGNYLVTVEMAGFKKGERRNIALLVNTTERVDIQLQPGEISETIEVTGAAPVLQTDRADTGRNIDTMVVSELPVLVSNRNYQALLALVPARRRQPRSTPNSLTPRTRCRPKSTGPRACPITTRSKASTTTSAPACCKS